jgi:hypothetical protein
MLLSVASGGKSVAPVPGAGGRSRYRKRGWHIVAPEVIRKERPLICRRLGPPPTLSRASVWRWPPILFELSLIRCADRAVVWMRPAAEEERRPLCRTRPHRTEKHGRQIFSAHGVPI